MTPALARRIRLCKHPARDVVLAETQDHVTDHHTRRWQFCQRCGAYRWTGAFMGKATYPAGRIAWKLPDLVAQALKETT